MTLFRKVVLAVVLVPIAVIIISFAVANRQAIVVSFDPFDSTQPAYAASMPLFVLIFVLLILGVIIGGTAAWLRQAPWRWAARRAESENRELRGELDVLRRQLGESQPARLSPPLENVPPTSFRTPVE